MPEASRVEPEDSHWVAKATEVRGYLIFERSVAYTRVYDITPHIYHCRAAATVTFATLGLAILSKRASPPK